METASVTFTLEEYDTIVYAAREAHIRFKRARTELRAGNERYAHLDEETITKDIEKYAELERMLIARWEESSEREWNTRFGKWWEAND